MHKFPRAVSAFTFLEIMIVVALLAIVAALIIPRMTTRGQLSPEHKAYLQMREIMKALELYRKDRGSYPTTAQGLQSLVTEAKGASEKDRGKKYLYKVPLDPWGHSYVYKCPGSGAGKLAEEEHKSRGELYCCYELTSYGPDGVESDDDIKICDVSGEWYPTSIDLLHMKEIIKALGLYKKDNGFYPSTAQGLKALVEEPAGEPRPLRWKRYFGMVPLDLWHHNYVYHCPPEVQLKRERGTVQSNGDSFELISPGPDGIPSGDDIRYFSGAGEK
jgi:general secretion pathway protein G